jgi:hypothetical protein
MISTSSALLNGIPKSPYSVRHQPNDQKNYCDKDFCHSVYCPGCNKRVCDSSALYGVLIPISVKCSRCKNKYVVHICI